MTHRKVIQLKRAQRYLQNQTSQRKIAMEKANTLAYFSAFSLTKNFLNIDTKFKAEK